MCWNPITYCTTGMLKGQKCPGSLCSAVKNIIVSAANGTLKMKSKKFLNRSSSVFRFQMLRDVIGGGPAHLRLPRSAGSAGWRDRATAAPGDRAAPPALQRCCWRSRKRVLSQLRSCGQATVQQRQRIKQSGFIAALHFSIAPSKGAPYEALGEL